MNTIDQTNNEQWIQHEVKLRLLECSFKSMQNTLDKLESKMDTGFDKLDARLDNKITGLYHLIIGAVAVPVTIVAITLAYSIWHH